MFAGNINIIVTFMFDPTFITLFVTQVIIFLVQISFVRPQVSSPQSTSNSETRLGFVFVVYKISCLTIGSAHTSTNLHELEHDDLGNSDGPMVPRINSTICSTIS